MKRLYQYLGKFLPFKNEKEFDVDFAFLYLGTKSNNELYQGFVDLNEHGYIISNEKLETKTDGVWVAGDIVSGNIRQVTTAVADGTKAGLESIKYIMRKKKEKK